MTTAPTITIPGAVPPRSISLTLGTMLEIEARLGIGLHELVFGRFAGLELGVPQDGTDEQKASARLRNIKVADAVQLVCACMGCTPQALGSVLPDNQLMRAWTACAEGLSEAVRQLHGGQSADGPEDGGADAGPPQTPGGSQA